MNHREKVEALRDKLETEYHQTSNLDNQFIRGQRRACREIAEKLDFILSEWPEETITPEITQCQLCGRFHHSSETDYCVSMRGAA